MTKIFISYRRADSGALVGRIGDRLQRHFGKQAVFVDTQSIPYAEKFRTYIGDALTDCDALLAVIGKHWFGADADGKPRLQSADDLVRVEIELALAGGIPIIPVLVDDTRMPDVTALPESLHDLAKLNAARIDSARDFHPHMSRLIATLDEIVARGHALRWPCRWLPGITFGLAAMIAVAAIKGMGWAGYQLPEAARLPIFAALALTSISGATLLGTAAAAHRKIPIGFFKVRPHAFGALCGGALTLIVGVAAITQEWSASARLVELAQKLRADFASARYELERSGKADFSAADADVQAILRLDPQNGHAWYYADEIMRVKDTAHFSPLSCFNGWRPGETRRLDSYEAGFNLYIEAAQALPAVETGGDPRAASCYERPRGFCPQRTAWISQLLATDIYEQALLLTNPAERADLLNQARRKAVEANKFQRLEGGTGFSQCIDTTVLIDRIDEMLRAR